MPSKILTLALDDERENVLVLSPERERVYHAQPILPDLDGEDVAIQTAAVAAVRWVLSS